MPHVRRWLPGRPWVVVVAGGLAAVSLARACVTSQVPMVSRLRWDAALSHRPAPHPPGQRGPKPLPGQRQRRLQAWAQRAATPWETVEVDGDGARRKQRWGLSQTALWHTRGLPPVDIRFVLGGAPEGKLRLAAFFCTDLQATPGPIRAAVVRRGSVAGTWAEARAHLGGETQRHGSDQASARTTPVLLGLCSRVTRLALHVRPDGQIPVPVTAWYHPGAPPFSAGQGLVRQPLWRARYLVHAIPEAEFTPWHRAAFDLLIHGRSLAASLAKAEL